MTPINLSLTDVTMQTLVPFLVSTLAIYVLHWIWNRLEKAFPPVGPQQ